MNDLTEQWKKGKLPEGWYYVKVDNKLANNPVITECVSDYNLSGKFIPDFYEYDDDKIVKVLAPVPSYEQWQAKLEDNKRLKHDVGNLGYKIKNQRHEIDNRLKEIEKLKEQINKCCLDAINRGTANAVKAVKEFGMPERIEELVKQNAQLKELLKECELWFTGIVGNMNDKNVGEHNRNLPIGNFEYMFKVFSQKINEALK